MIAGPTLSELKALAVRGHIHESAPACATLSLPIAADAARVWDVLGGIERWRDWHPDIGPARFDEPVDGPAGLRPGLRFTWKMGGMRIRSELARVEPGRALAWTGSLLGMKAIHGWTLIPGAADTTIVEVRESLDGLLVRAFMNEARLRATLWFWLTCLQRACERERP